MVKSTTGICRFLRLRVDDILLVIWVVLSGNVAYSQEILAALFRTEITDIAELRRRHYSAALNAAQR